MVAPSRGSGGGCAEAVDRSGGLTPPRRGGVEVARERKFLAGPEGWTMCIGGGLIGNNKTNSIIYDVGEGGVGTPGKIELAPEAEPSD